MTTKLASGAIYAGLAISYALSQLVDIHLVILTIYRVLTVLGQYGEALLIQGQLLLLWVDDKVLSIEVRLLLCIDQVRLRFNIDGSVLFNADLVVGPERLVSRCNFFIPF